jgi:hypothetical protein
MRIVTRLAGPPRKMHTIPGIISSPENSPKKGQIVKKA